jgi:hypothetical protein
MTELDKQEERNDDIAKLRGGDRNRLVLSLKKRKGIATKIKRPRGSREQKKNFMSEM